MELHVIVCAGLANRLRAFVSACCWAQHLHCNLRITWPIGGMDCNAKFQDLFTQSSLPSWIRIDLGPVFTKSIQITCENDMKEYVKSGKKEPIESYSRFWEENCSLWNKSLQFLQPLTSLSIQNGVKECWVGVHIRRGDHRHARQHSPLTLFLPFIEEKLEKGFYVFVASDDFETLQEISRLIKHPKCILSEFWKGGRGTRQGIQNAVRDIWMLAQCGKGIASSYNSSFGEFASWIHNVPFKIIHNG